MTRADRLSVVIVLVIALAGVGGCAGRDLESRTRRLLGDRVEEVKTVTPPQAFNSFTSFTLDVTLAQGPVPEAAACELLAQAATRVSKDETAGVSFRLMRSDTATDSVDYTWCGGTSKLIRWESLRSGGSLRTGFPVAYVDGVTSGDLKRFGSGSERPAWRAWPGAGYPPTAK